MTVITQSANLGDLLKYEAPMYHYSRDTILVATGQNLSLGTVVGIQTADGNAYALDPAASDGTETAAGVLLYAVDATSADMSGVIVARHAIVSVSALVWPVGITNNQKLAALAQLKSIGIISRTGA